MVLTRRGAQGIVYCMNLFLQGPVQLGKSTLIRQALHGREAAVAGFTVQRLYKNGHHAGFSARAVAGQLPAVDEPYDENDPGLFIDHGRPNLAPLRGAMAAALPLCRDERCKLVVLDEIGGLELEDAPFMAGLNALLALGKPCTGVVKSAAHLTALTRRLAPGQGQKLMAAHAALVEKITAGGGKVLCMDHHNAPMLLAQLQSFAQTIIP